MLSSSPITGLLEERYRDSALFADGVTVYVMTGIPEAAIRETVGYLSKISRMNILPGLFTTSVEYEVVYEDFLDAVRVIREFNGQWVYGHEMKLGVVVYLETDNEKLQYDEIYEMFLNYGKVSTVVRLHTEFLGRRVKYGIVYDDLLNDRTIDGYITHVHF